MLGELYGFVRGGSLDFDCLKPLEHFEPKNPVVNKQYLIGTPSYDLLDPDLNFSTNYNGNPYYTGSITVSGTIISFLIITGTQITVK
jgi:hypothetical protein